MPTQHRGLVDSSSLTSSTNQYLILFVFSSEHLSPRLRADMARRLGILVSRRIIFGAPGRNLRPVSGGEYCVSAGAAGNSR